MAPAQVAPAWLLGRPAVNAAIVGATKLGHLDDAVASVDVTLAVEEIARLEAPYRPTPSSATPDHGYSRPLIDLERALRKRLVVVEIEVMAEAIIGIEQGISIQAASDRTGLTAHTLRYYERIGLIHEVRRGTDGRRRYSPDDLAWLEFLTKLRKTGMPIRDMCRYAELRRTGDHTAAARKAMLEEHRVRVAARIAELQQDLKVLDYKIDNYAKAMETL